MQALEICYIRLCHKAELRAMFSEASPRHPHAPRHKPGATHNPASQRPPAPGSNASEQSVDMFMQGQASNPGLDCLSAPSASVVGSQPDSSSHGKAAAVALPASEATWEEAVPQSNPPSGAAQFGLNQIDYCCMHSPFHKLVRKAFARLTHIDHLRRQTPSYQGAIDQEQVKLQQLSARIASVANCMHKVELSTLYAQCWHTCEHDARNVYIPHAMCT